MKEALNRYRTLIRNSAFNLSGQAINVIAALVCVPIAFRVLGPEKFGLLGLMWTMLSNTILFDLGTGPAVARAVAGSLVNDEGRRIAAIVKAGAVIQIAVGVCVTVVLMALSGSILRILSVPPELMADAHRAFYGLALSVPVVLLIQSQQGVLEGLERFDLLNYVRTPMAVANFAIPAIGALAGWSLATMIFGIVGTRVVGVLLMHSMYRGKLPPEQHGTFTNELRGLFQFGRWLAISGALTQVLLYIDRYMLSSLRGLGAVAQYSAPYDAATKLLVLPGSVGVAMFPGLTKDFARGQTLDAAGRARAAGRMTTWIMVPVCALLIPLAGPLLHLWLGPQLSDTGVMAFRILVFATLLHAASFPPVILMEAMGRSDTVARYYLAELPIYILVLWPAISRYGVAGAAWTWVARSAALLIWSTWRARHYVRKNAAAQAYSHAH